MNQSVRVVCRGCLRSVEKSAAANDGQPGRCPFCGDQLDSRPSQGNLDDPLDSDDPDGTSRAPTEIREPIDWVKTWAQGSLGSLGRFQLRERMGDGGFGSVFRAYDPRLDRDVAVKILKQRNPSERVMERFFREARAVARLDHPNIVAVYDSGFDDGRCWVAYQLVSGRPLWWYREHHPIDAATAARIIRALADALDHSHHLGVVHRDLKPANVIIDDRGQPRLIDFGLARRSDLESDLTRDGAILGTPAYMSPEQALGRSRQVDERTDVYSLGVIFYELLTGHHPDEPSTTSSDRPPPPRLAATVLRAAQRVHSMNPSVPRALRHICAKAMAADACARFPTARALADELDSYLAREQRKNDRLRLALAGAVAGLSLAAMLLIAIAIIGRAQGNRTGAHHENASGPTSPIASDPESEVGGDDVSEVAARVHAAAKTNVSPPAGIRLIGNRDRHTYHLATCRHLGDMVKTNQEILIDARDAAQKNYSPCKDCKPPVLTASPTQSHSASNSQKKR